MKTLISTVAAALLISPGHSETWHQDPISGCTVWDDEDVPDKDALVSWSEGCDAEGKSAGAQGTGPMVG